MPARPATSSRLTDDEKTPRHRPLLGLLLMQIVQCPSAGHQSTHPRGPLVHCGRAGPPVPRPPDRNPLTSSSPNLSKVLAAIRAWMKHVPSPKMAVHPGSWTRDSTLLGFRQKSSPGRCPTPAVEPACRLTSFFSNLDGNAVARQGRRSVVRPKSRKEEPYTKSRWGCRPRPRSVEVPPTPASAPPGSWRLPGTFVYLPSSRLID